MEYTVESESIKKSDYPDLTARIIADEMNLKMTGGNLKWSSVREKIYLSAHDDNSSAEFVVKELENGIATIKHNPV